MTFSVAPMRLYIKSPLTALISIYVKLQLGALDAMEIPSVTREIVMPSIVIDRIIVVVLTIEIANVSLAQIGIQVSDLPNSNTCPSNT